ncbi:MAG TPA: hypothetical protein VKZ63_07545, partial [Kofleriaceae bacterium]|nr:hypothetical protein [Kofleriaceae bacterium]
QGVKIRMARGLNAELGRTGQVFGDRYHAALLTTPKKVREALAYLFQDARRHGEALDPRWGGVDSFTSAWYFDGWASDAWRRGVTPPRGEPPVAPPQTAPLRQGWRRHGAIGLRERPAVALFECM